MNLMDEFVSHSLSAMDSPRLKLPPPTPSPSHIVVNGRITLVPAMSVHSVAYVDARTARFIESVNVLQNSQPATPRHGCPPAARGQWYCIIVVFPLDCCLMSDVCQRVLPVCVRRLADSKRSICPADGRTSPALRPVHPSVRPVSRWTLHVWRGGVC